MINTKVIVIMAQNDARSKRMAVLPDGFGTLETMLYREIYYLCRAFDDGEISSDGAREAKNLYVGEYNTAKRKRAIYDEHMQRMAAISELLLEAEKNGCEYCKRIARIFDGRDNCDNQNATVHD